MITDQIKLLEEARIKVADLESAIAEAMRSELASLPSKYGFKSPEAFIAALRQATSDLSSHRLQGKSPRRLQKRAKRAVITDGTRAQVKELVTLGKSAAEIATLVGISTASIHNIKKSLGLVKSRDRVG